MDPMTPSAVAEITPSGKITEITYGVNPTGLEDGDSILAGINGACGSPTMGPERDRPNRHPPDRKHRYDDHGFSRPPRNQRDGHAACRHDGGFDSVRHKSVARLLGRGWVARGGHDQGAGDRDAHRPSLEHDDLLPGGRDELGRRVRGTVESFKTSPLAPSVQKTTGTLENQQITLTTPATSVCTASKSTLAVILNSTAIRNSKKAKLKFSSAVLYIDKGVKHTIKKTVRKHGKEVKVTVTTYKANATVKKLPASPKLKLSGLKSGRHTLKVTLSYIETVTNHGHKTKKLVHKTLTVKFKIC